MVECMMYMADMCSKYAVALGVLKILYGEKFEFKTKLLQSIMSVLRLETSTWILSFFISGSLHH